MLTSRKLGLFATVAAVWIAAANSAGAAVNPASPASTGAASADASFAVEAQARVLRKCEEDFGYGRTGGFGCGG